MTLIDDLLDLQIPNSLRISPTGTQVVFATTLSFGHVKGDKEISTLWLAETGKPGSARQLTSGQHHDRDPRWLPDGRSLAFLSDRAKPGRGCAIYILPLEGGREAYPATPAEDERLISQLEVSPDGKTIAFISADEKAEARKRREEEKDDAQVWGEDWTYSRLRLLHLATKTVTTVGGGIEGHVCACVWNEAGTQLAFTEARTPDVESTYLQGTEVSTVDVRTEEVVRLCRFPNSVPEMVWAGDAVYFQGKVTPASVVSAYAVYRIGTGVAEQKYERVAHGEENCAMGLGQAGSDVFVRVAHGLEDQIRMLDGKTLFSRRQKIESADVAFTHDSDEIVLAVALGDTNHPSEVYTTTASGGDMVRLTNFGLVFADQKFGTCTFLSCTSSDGKVELECPWIAPAGNNMNANEANPKQPLPTVVLAHGGPYNGRLNESFDAYYYMWAPLLLDAGYGLLLVDYRGSNGRGERWAAYARGVGRHDYDDIIALTQHAIVEGYADPSRLAIGGWSYGGYLTYLSAVRNGTHGHGWTFRAAISGAGISDWDTACFSSDMGGTFGVQVMAAKPWASHKDFTANRLGSAMWEFGEAMENGAFIPPMLILHGEKDSRVPLEQARAMRMALSDMGLPFEYVVYPRAGHILGERNHWVDMGKRVLRWVDTHLREKQ